MKKAWKSLAALPLLACFLQAASSAVSELPLPEKNLPGLDAILRSAVQQSPRMVNRALDLEAADNDRIAARSGLLPTLSAGYSYNKASDLTGNNTARNTSTKTPYSVTLWQPLFQWGERRNNDKIGAIQLKIAQGQYRQGYRLLAQELRTSYLRLIVQKLALKRAHFYQQFVGNQLSLQEKRLLKKEISEVDISIARQNAENAQLALERSEFDFANTKRSFARLAGMGSIGDESIPDSVSDTTYATAPVDQLLGEFLAEKEPVTFDAYILRQQIDVENLNYANAKTRLRPKVNAVLGISQDEQSNIYGQGSKYTNASRYVGLSVNWTIFDGFAAGAATRNALIRRRALENNYHLLTEQLAQDAQSAVKQINFSARTMAIFNRQLTSNQGYLNTMKEDFRRGIKSEADVGQVQLNVYDAEINANNARADFFVRNCELLGVLNEDPIVANLPVK
jgi:outer membrane protein TolC